MHPEASDATLWAQVRTGDETAFAAVFDRYHARVQHTVARHLADVAGADVAAVASEVFHTAWQRRSSVEVQTSVWPWLRAVTTRLCANERRRCLRQDRLTARAVATGPIELVEPDHAAAVAMQVAFTTALSRLGSAEAEVAELAIVHDLSEAEMAHRLSVPVGTVKSRLHRARRQLRQHLGARADTLRPSRPDRTTPWRGTTADLTPTRAGVAYATDSPSQRLDLWTPAADGAAPLVVFVHGGGWHEGSRTSVTTKVRPLLDAGFAVASVDFRLSGDQPFPAAVEDVAAAVQHLTALDDVDGDRVALWGESAGATIACVVGALAGRTPPWAGPGGPPWPRVAAVVDWFGPTDLARTDDHATLAGPLPHLAAADPTMLPEFAIAHGTADCVVAPGQSAVLADALHARGVTPWVTWLDRAGHDGHRFDAELMIPTIDWLQQVLETR